MSILKDNVNEGPEHLRAMIKRRCISIPGVFNGISAEIAERHGFEAVYLSGSGIAGAEGLPDLSLTTLTEVAEKTAEIASVTKLPIVVDVDTGFGETLNVMRTVRAMERAGASAIHIEDQELPKKCGQLSGKKLVAEEEMVNKIRAAVEARKNESFIIIARTDSRALEGIDGAVRRAKIYLEAGADAIFPEALESKSEFEKFAKAVRAPLMANMTEFGKSPLLTVKELDSMGYRMVIFPLTAFRASLRAMDSAYSELKRAGTQKSFVENLMTREDFYKLIGYYEYEKEDSHIYKYKKAPK